MALPQDIRQTMHRLFLQPGVPLFIVILLGIGIGANTAIFSVVYGVLLRPLPYADPDRLAVLWATIPKKDIRSDWTSWPTLQYWRRSSRSFVDVAGILRIDTATLTGRDEPMKVNAGRVSANLFSLLGVSPLVGRTYTAEEERLREPLVVLSYKLWRSQFNSSRSAVGSRLEIDHKIATIIGVMPETFAFPDPHTELWLPLTFVPQWPAFLVARQADAFQGIARLRSDVSFEQAQAELDIVAGQLARQHPETERGKGIAVVPLARQITDSRVRLALWLLFGAVATVLLIACSNAASLLLARGLARRREFAIRAALGAGRARLVQQLLVESTILALVAGVLGLALTVAGVRTLIVFAPPDLPRLHEIRISVPVLAFSLCISLLTGIFFGLIPAWQLSFSQPIDALKQFSRTQAGGLGNQRIRALMVAGEFALAVILLTGAGLLVRSLLSLQKVELGFRPDGLLMASIELPEWRTNSTSRPAAFFEQAIAEVRAIPGVENAGVISGMFDNYVPNTQIVTEGRNAEIGQPGFPCTRTVLSDDFVRVIGVPLLRGRYFTAQDNSQAPAVALINETMARQFWPGADPVNKRFRFGSPGAIEPAWVTVVGVAGDMHPYGPESHAIAAFYLPHRQAPWVGSMDLVIRARTGVAMLAGPVRAAVRSVDNRVPRFEIGTVDHRLTELSAPRRFETWLLGGFSAIGLLLAAFGIYGLLHHLVAQRTQEIGIRMALGATPASVARRVMSHGMRFAVVGIAIGVATSLGLTRLMGHLLFGVSPTDPLTFAAATAFLILVAAAASYFPARRARNLDPLLLLRYD